MKISLGNHDPLEYLPITKDGSFKPSTASMTRLPAYEEADKNKIFQIDPSSFDTYYQSKLAGRAERLSKYTQTNSVSHPEIYSFIAETLSREYPDLFTVRASDGVMELHSKLTNETFSFHVLNGELVNSSFDYVDTFDALSMQVPEDLVIHALRDKKDFVSEVSLFHANGWSAEGAIGKDFRFIHQDVPNIEKLIPHPEKLVEGIIRSGKTVERVGAISFRTTSELNRHPDDPEPKEFNLEDPSLFMRFERQTVTGFPNSSAFLFTIKTYFVDCDQRNTDLEKHQKILEAFKKDPSKLYSKWFFENYQQQVIQWLEGQ